MHHICTFTENFISTFTDPQMKLMTDMIKKRGYPQHPTNYEILGSYLFYVANDATAIPNPITFRPATDDEVKRHIGFFELFELHHRQKFQPFGMRRERIYVQNDNIYAAYTFLSAGGIIVAITNEHCQKCQTTFTVYEFASKNYINA